MSLTHGRRATPTFALPVLEEGTGQDAIPFLTVPLLSARAWSFSLWFPLLSAQTYHKTVKFTWILSLKLQSNTSTVFTAEQSFSLPTPRPSATPKKSVFIVLSLKIPYSGFFSSLALSSFYIFFAFFVFLSEICLLGLFSPTPSMLSRVWKDNVFLVDVCPGQLGGLGGLPRQGASHA